MHYFLGCATWFGATWMESKELRELAGALTAARRAAVAALEVRSASAARAYAGRERARRAARALLRACRRALVTVSRAGSEVQPWLAAALHSA